MSTLDLVPLGGFALITCTPDAGWQDAVRRVAAELGVPIECFVIHARTDVVAAESLVDAETSWARLREVAVDGAVLVRPDDFVGWRARELPADPTTALRAALASLLQRKVPGLVASAPARV